MSLLLLFGGAAPVTSSKTGAAVAGTELAGTDVAERSETGTAAAGGLLAGQDARQAAETGTTDAGATAAGTAQAGFVSKAGKAVTEPAATGADSAEHAETGTATTDAQLTGLDQSGSVSKTGTAALETWASAADQYTATETGTAKTKPAASGYTVPPAGPTGKFTLRDVRVVIANTDVSTLCHQVQVTYERSEIDVTPLGSPYRVTMDGVETASLQASMHADQAVLTPAFWRSLDTPAPVSVTPRSYPTAPTNPTWTGTAVAIRKTPLTASVGEAAEAQVELRSVGQLVQNES